MVGKASEQERGAAGNTVPVVRTQTLTLVFLSVWNPGPQDFLYWVNLSVLLSPI